MVHVKNTRRARSYLYGGYGILEEGLYAKIKVKRLIDEGVLKSKLCTFSMSHTGCLYP
jgi:hypothetical protein